MSPFSLGQSLTASRNPSSSRKPSQTSPLGFPIYTASLKPRNFYTCLKPPLGQLIPCPLWHWWRGRCTGSPSFSSESLPPLSPFISRWQAERGCDWRVLPVCCLSACVAYKHSPLEPPQGGDSGSGMTILNSDGQTSNAEQRLGSDSR